MMAHCFADFLIHLSAAGAPSIIVSIVSLIDTPFNDLQTNIHTAHALRRGRPFLFRIGARCARCADIAKHEAVASANTYKPVDEKRARACASAIRFSTQSFPRRSAEPLR